jgi:hypothetical protein
MFAPRGEIKNQIQQIRPVTCIATVALVRSYVEHMLEQILFIFKCDEAVLGLNDFKANGVTL